MSEQERDLLPLLALLTIATTSIYAGSYGTLKSTRKPKGGKNGIDHDDDDDDEDIPDRLSASDAYLFPILGSVALFGLYLVVKFLGKEWINWFLGWYFTFAGIASVWKCSISLTRLAVGRDRWRKYDKWKFLILQGPWEMLSISMRSPSLALFIPSLIPSILYQYLPGPKKSAIITDILALSFSHSALSVLKLDKFQTGVILLSGLFLYDIWWVFGTEVMVKVATSLDIPIKILWPRSLSNLEKGFTMLGLGDIVIPGMFVSTALRYDLSQSKHKDLSKPFAKPYFKAAMIAYMIGLGTTMVVMHTFNAAQPALLYISPSCILSFFIAAFTRGEFKEAWSWEDETQSPEDDAVLKVLEDKEKPSRPESASGGQPAIDKIGETEAAHIEGTEADDQKGTDEETEGVDGGSTKKKRKSKKKRT